MIKKFLIVAPGWIGDMVMAHALIQLLKHRDVNCTIDVLAMPGIIPVVEHMPEVNTIIPAPFKHGSLNLFKRLTLGTSLRDQHYDQAIVLRNNFKSALIPWRAKIPLRTGWLGEKRWGLLNDIRYLQDKRALRTIEKYALLVESSDTPLPAYIPRPKLSVDANECQKTLAKFQLQTEQPILALCPGAEFGVAKRWPPEYYAEVAKQMQSVGWQVWLFGGPNDQAIGETLQKYLSTPCVNLIGRTRLGEAIALLALSKVVVSNDSGLMHLSLALDRSVVIPYGATDCGFRKDQQPKAYPLSLELGCSPCFKRDCPLQHHRCMQDLKPQIVLDTLHTIINLKALP